jgi:hypothetical protein
MLTEAVSHKTRKLRRHKHDKQWQLTVKTCSGLGEEVFPQTPSANLQFATSDDMIQQRAS